MHQLVNSLFRHIVVVVVVVVVAVVVEEYLYGAIKTEGKGKGTV